MSDVDGGVKYFLLTFLLTSMTQYYHYDFQLKSNYSQTCSNDHLYKMTSLLRQPPLSLQKQIPIQSLMCKTTTCLTTSDHFFVSQMDKNLSKTTTAKFYPSNKWERNIRQQGIKNKCLSDYSYSIATL